MPDGPAPTGRPPYKHTPSRIARFALGCGLAMAMTASAVAQTSAERQALQDNCTRDYFMHCAGLSPDGPEIRACFKRNRAKLSQGCNSAIAAYEASNARRQSVR